MSCKPIIELNNLGKCYRIYANPGHRLLEMLLRGRKCYHQQFWALKNVSVRLQPGDVVGIIGRNGSGKSTLLQLVCGTLTPTTGTIAVRGRIAALLELGAGFNPEFTGRENIYLSAALYGLDNHEINSRLQDIIDFSGIAPFIDQPVRTYSSGMYVRLAFSVAINVDPDILVIDEALSVGDGEFSRRSFNRIMELKNAGKTILFCSHAMYQVEALCNYVIWLDHGEVKKEGETGSVTHAYNLFLQGDTAEAETGQNVDLPAVEDASPVEGSARIRAVELSVNDQSARKHINVTSRQDTVKVKIEFVSDLSQPVPAVGVVFSDANEKVITSAGSHIDQFPIVRDGAGVSSVVVEFPEFPLLKGEYWLYVFILCDKGILVLDYVHAIAQVTVRQNDIEQGVVSIPHHWHGEVE